MHSGRREDCSTWIKYCSSSIIFPLATRQHFMERDGGNCQRTASIVLTTDGWTSRATESSPTYDCPLHHFRVGDKKLCFKDTPSFTTATQVSISLKHWQRQWQNGNWRGLTVQSLSPQTMQKKDTVNVVNVTPRTAPTEHHFLGKVRKMVTFFHRSTTTAHVWATKQEMLPSPVDIINHDVTTHWNIIHDMLECYVEHQAAVYSALTDKDVKKNVKDFSYLYNVSKSFS